MGSDPRNDVVSLSGSPVWHHGEPAPFQPAQGEMCLQQIGDHIARHLGKVESVFHEVVSDTVHVDVHFVEASDAFPFRRLVTSGMSDLPMTTPEGADVPRHAELMVTLPADWKLDMASFEDEAWYWPVRLLKTLARLPHKHATWLGFGHTVPNGDPPQPYAANTRLCGAIVVPPLSAPEDFHTLEIDAGKTIAFYSVVPIHAAEMELKLRKGSDALFDRFDAKGIADIVDPRRPDVAKRRFWPF
jgi:hypothetical protein